MLAIPDIRQDDEHSCGDAAVSAALAALGLRRRPGTKLANPWQGMAPDTVAAVLRASGAAVLAGPVLTGIEGLRHYTAAGFPVLCPIAERGGHWVVVRGVSRGRVHFHCPVAGEDSRRAGAWLEVWADRASETGQAFDRWGIVVGT
jgi:hypothetical protein